MVRDCWACTHSPPQPKPKPKSRSKRDLEKATAEAAAVSAAMASAAVDADGFAVKAHMIGTLTLDERRIRIERYLEKRKKR
jgi:hypothetical protein